MSAEYLPLRQKQVLEGIADGLSNAEIGRRILISVDTVKCHANDLYQRLGAKNRAHAVTIGFRRGWLS